MRQRDIDDYQDDDQHWERRPSLWIEPLGDWGEGAVQLVEIPSESEINDNIVAYWRPKAAARRRQGGDLRLSAVLVLGAAERARRLRSPSRARSGRAPGGKLRRFIVVFSGDVSGRSTTSTTQSYSRLDDLSGIGDEHSHLSQSAGEDVPRRLRRRPRRRDLLRAAPRPAGGRATDQRNLALSMDAVTLAPVDDPPRAGMPAASSDPAAAPPTPIERRLSMPAQNLFKFDARQRAQAAAP